MRKTLRCIFGENELDLKARLIAIYSVVGALNVGAWLWAFIAFHDRSSLLLVSLAIYGLGLRHAVDADHLAAIDNVTRKLLQMRLRPVSVGFFFAMGHSTVVFIAAAAVAATATLLDGFDTFKSYGSVIGALVSALFLLAIAVMNIAIFLSLYRTYRRVRAGGSYVEEDLDLLLDNRGFLSCLLRPVFKLVTKSWHMYPLGFLFGLGFDTATEVALFGVSAAQTAKDVPFASILAFPVLFAAGMALVDTTDGVMMLGAYEWAFVKPIRKLFYNMTITAVSILVALLIGCTEVLGLLCDQLRLKDGPWHAVGALNENLNSVGFGIVAFFAVAWALSYAVYRIKRFDDGEITVAGR